MEFVDVWRLEHVSERKLWHDGSALVMRVKTFTDSAVSIMRFREFTAIFQIPRLPAGKMITRT